MAHNSVTEPKLDEIAGKAFLSIGRKIGFEYWQWSNGCFRNDPIEFEIKTVRANEKTLAFAVQLLLVLIIMNRRVCAWRRADALADTMWA